MVSPVSEQLIEFRNYRIVPDGTDAFVEHFEAHFLESQEDLGMDIVGQLRVVDDAERFVWVRRFLDPTSRGPSLERFYTGPVWERFGPRANELMVDHTDVHLLVPHPSAPTFAADHVPHADRRDPPVDPSSTVVAALFDLTGTEGRLPPPVTVAMTTAIQADEITELGRLVTANVSNDFPLLPVHDRPVALWLLSDDEQSRTAVATAQTLGQQHDLPLQTIRLTPTPRSTLR